MRTTTVILADDLTGACDTGIKLAKKKFDTQVFALGCETAQELAQCGSPAAAVNTDSRALSPKEAYERTAAAAALVKQAGVENLYKKIDSVFRGNVGAELAALLEQYDLAVVAPALPENGRILRDGMVIFTADGTGENKIDAAAAIRETAPQLRVGTISADVVRKGAQPLKEAIEAQRRQGAQVVLLDGETDADLRVSAQAISGLSCKAAAVGSAGLIGHLDMLFRLTPSQTETKRSPAAFAVAAVGSLHPATLAQTRRLAQRGDFALVEAVAGVSAEELVKSAVEQVNARGKSGSPCRGLIVATDRFSAPVDREVMTKNRTDVAVADRIARIAAGAANQLGARAFLATGGDTAAALLRALHCRRIRLCDEPVPGAPVSELLPQGEFPVYLATKSGGFGEEDALCRLADSLFFPEETSVKRER